MLRKSLILVSCLFFLVLAIIGCGGGGSAGNPTGPALVSGVTASLSGTVLFNNAAIPFASVNLCKSEKAHTVGMAQLPSLKGSLVAQQIIGDGAYSTTTNAEGVYNFVDVPVGQYTLTAMRDENHQFVQTGVLLGQVTTLNPQLTPTGKITGNVSIFSGSTSQGVSGAFVYIDGTSYIAVTNTAGNFTINNVPSNQLSTSSAYTILVSTDKGSASSLTGVVVNPGATTNVGTIALTHPSTASYVMLNGSLVAGTMVTATELAGQFVILTHQTSGTVFGTHTGSTGNYVFRVTETGTYLVLCTDEDYCFTPDPLTVNVTNLDNGNITLSPIAVDADQAQEIGSIVGSVNFSGSPVAGAVVHASGTSLIGVTSAEGNFVINNVPINSSSNPYTVELSSNMGFAPAKTGVVVNTGQVTDVGAFSISAPTANYKTITGQLVAIPPVTTGMLTGRLVQMTTPEGKTAAAYSDATGAFSFITTQTGDFKITVIDASLAFTPHTQTANVTVLDNGSQALTNINVSDPKLDNRIRVAGFVNKTIRIRPETDNSGVSLKLDPESATEQNLFTFSHADGSFEFFVVPGTYTLSVEGRYQLDPPSPLITINVTSAFNFPSPIAVRPALTVNSAVAGSVTWPAVAGWNFTEGEVILESASFVDRRIISNVSPAPFRFENVPPGTYTLKSNPLRNGYASSTAAFIVTEDFDVTGQSLLTTFIAPFITLPSAADNILSVSGTNFGTLSANLQAMVNEKPVTTVSLTDTSASFNIASLPPGEHTVQLIKTIPEGKLAGNRAVFVRPVMPPPLASFVASSTDKSITFTWQNAPYVKEVDIRLMQGAAVVRPFMRIVGNSFTYDKLLATTTPYTIEVSSTYPYLPNSAATAFSFTTQADGINNIPSVAFLPGTGSIATGTVFGFEVSNGIAYVGFDNSGPITIQAFNLSSNVLEYTSSQVITNSDHPMRSLAANSGGVYLTYADANASPTIAFFSSTLGAPAQTENIETRFSLGSYLDMATVRSLNDRIFLVTASGTWPTTMYLFEVDSSLNAVQTANPIAGGSNLQQKMADIAWDRTSNTLYLACPNDSNIASLRAFSAMNLTSAPQYIGDFAPSTKQILGLYANNNRVYLSQDALSYPLLTVMESVSGYVTEIYSTYPGSFGFDRQNRIWGGSLNTSFDKYYLFQYDNAMNVLQSLNIYNTDYVALNLPMVRLDESTGIMYMLHFNANSQLAVYRYNSNY